MSVVQTIMETIAKVLPDQEVDPVIAHRRIISESVVDCVRTCRKRGRSQPAGRRAKAWCANPRSGTSFTYKQRTGPHEYKENSCQL